MQETYGNIKKQYDYQHGIKQKYTEVMHITEKTHIVSDFMAFLLFNEPARM